MIVAQIESPRGVENAAKIAEVPGVDVIFTAANDLASFSGYSQGTPEHEALVSKINDAVLGAGKKLGGPAEWLKREEYSFFQTLPAANMVTRGTKDLLNYLKA